MGEVARFSGRGRSRGKGKLGNNHGMAVPLVASGPQIHPQNPRGSFGGRPNSAGKGYCRQLENIKFL
ncbi:MAG: hypothetical protein RLZZ143_2238 [Cyanobacteriota bacterium]|jgi:hypothetical protein